MGIIGLSSSVWDEQESKLGGFSLCPAGTGMLFQLTAFREGTYEHKKTGEPVEYVTFGLTHMDQNNVKHDHWEFFNLDKENLGYLKGFLEKIERQDVMRKGEDAEWEDLYGTAFTTDIRHRVKNKETKEIASNMQQNAITAVSHEDGKEVEGWKEQIGLEDVSPEKEEEEVKPAKKVKKVKKVKKPKPVEPPEEEEEEEETEEEEEEEEEEEKVAEKKEEADVKTSPKHAVRRSRRAARED